MHYLTKVIPFALCTIHSYCKLILLIAQHLGHLLGQCTAHFIVGSHFVPSIFDVTVLSPLIIKATMKVGRSPVMGFGGIIFYQTFVNIVDILLCAMVIETVSKYF